MSGTTVARNSAVLIAAEVAKKGIGVVTAILIARALSVDDFGRLRLAMALVAIFEVLANFGLSPLLTRDVAAHPGKSAATFGLVQSLKTILGAVAAAAMIGFALLSGYEGATLVSVVIAAGIVLFSPLESSCVALFDGRQEMSRSSWIAILRSTLLLLGVVVALGLHWSLYGVVAAYLVAALATAGYGNALVARHVGGFSFRPRLAGGADQLRRALPFLLIGMVWMLLFRIDTIMLQALKNEQSVGLYSSGYSFFEFLLVVPILVTRALYPALSAARAESHDKWRDLLRAAVRIYWILALPLAIGSFFVGARFVPLLYGAKYTAGGDVVPLLGSFIWLWFATMTFGWALSAADRLKLVLAANVTAMVVNVAANLVLIPRFDFFGAALATVISEAVLVTIFLVALQRTGDGLPSRVFPVRALPAALALLAWLLVTRELNLALATAGGAVVYLGAAWLGGILTPDERAIIRNLLRRKTP